MVTATPRILIVDDDEDCLRNLSDILTDAGYQTETATTGRKALDLIERVCSNDHCQFDLCLFDFKMPEMDGATLLEEIRKNGSELKAIMITAFASDDGMQRAVGAGVLKVLRKPVDIPHLLGIIQKTFGSESDWE